MTKLIGILSGRDVIGKAKMAKKLGVELLEFRFDLIPYKGERGMRNLIKCVKETVGLPLILTVRRKSEGGNFPDGFKRFKVYERFIDLVDIVDVEISSKIALEVVKLGKNLGKRVILSYHNLVLTPSVDELREVMWKFRGLGGWLMKVVTRVRFGNDLGRLIDFFLSMGNDLIVFGCGRLGIISRVIFILLGVRYMYGHLGSETVEGQLSCRDLVPIINIMLSKMENKGKKYCFK